MNRRVPRSPTARLALVSAVAWGALCARSFLPGDLGSRFFAWNLFLAWIPYLLALAIAALASRTRHGSGVLVLPTALWLLFFPNAPYIATDLVHLGRSLPQLVVLDALVIGLVAAVGMALGLLSLRRVHAVVAERLGTRRGWLFVGAVFLLTGAGVWMGRVLRWNSWDVFTNPRPMLARVLDAVLAPWNHPHAVGFSLAFALGLLLLYRRAFRRAPAPARTVR